MKVKVLFNPKKHQQSQYQPQQAPVGYDQGVNIPQQESSQEQAPESQEQGYYKLGGNAGYGQQNGSPFYSLNLGHYPFDADQNYRKEPFAFKSSIDEVPRENATLEAEKGETLTRRLPDGSLTQFNIGGKPHSQGGTPLEGKPGDFIFSQTKKMAIGGPILELFGKSGVSDKKYVPADLAKQYNINKYQSILADPDSDNLEKKTAEMMISNFSKKLQDLAEIQEMKKSFPTGMPKVAKYGGLLKAQNGLYDPKDPESIGQFQQKMFIEHPDLVKQAMEQINPKTGKPWGMPAAGTFVDKKDGPRTRYLANYAQDKIEPTSKWEMPAEWTPWKVQVEPEDKGFFRGISSDDYKKGPMGYSDGTKDSSSENTPLKEIRYKYPKGNSNADNFSLMSAMTQNFRVPDVNVPAPTRPQFTKLAMPDNAAELAAFQANRNAARRYLYTGMDGQRAQAADSANSGDQMEGVAKSFANLRNEQLRTQEINAKTADQLFNKYQDDTTHSNLERAMMNRQQIAERNRLQNQYMQNLNATQQQIARNNMQRNWLAVENRNQPYTIDKNGNPKFIADDNGYNEGIQSGRINPSSGSLDQELAYYMALAKKQDDKAGLKEALSLMHLNRMTQSMKMGNMSSKSTSFGLNQGFGSGAMDFPYYGGS